MTPTAEDSRRYTIVIPFVLGVLVMASISGAGEASSAGARKEMPVSPVFVPLQNSSSRPGGPEAAGGEGTIHASAELPMRGSPQGRDMSAPKGITIVFTLDRDVYAYNLQPPLPPVIAGPVVRAEITLSNQSDGDLQLDFRSSQRFDFILEDEAGKVVFQWSADKAFLTVLGVEIVKSGTSLTYAKEFSLPDSTAGILPEGVYTMRGVITTEKRWYSASLPLRIVHTR